MSYLTLWLKGNEIVGEKEFSDPLEAKQYILRQLRIGHSADVTTIKVINRGRTCFEISPAACTPAR